MKAVRCRSYGDSRVLVYEDADHPVAGPRQVVVKVAGAAFNPVDATIRAGFVRQAFPVAFPHVANCDLAGVITEIGEGVSGWSAGDAVLASLPMTGPSAAAEYAAVPAETLVAAPSAVELARQAGATVTAAASARSIHRLRSYGADRIVDTVIPLLQLVAGHRFDVVLNLAPTSPEETAQLVELVADGGAFVSTTTRGPEYAGRGVRTVRAFVRSDTSQLAELVARVDSGDLKIEMAERRPPSDRPTVHGG